MNFQAADLLTRSHAHNLTDQNPQIFQVKNLTSPKPQNTPLVVAGIFKLQVYVTKPTVNMYTLVVNAIVNYMAKSHVPININISYLKSHSHFYQPWESRYI